MLNTRRSVDPETLPYRPCIGIAVFNREGNVWSGRRILSCDEAGNITRPWQLPQGGIDKGESPLDAAYRELWEETGIRSVRFIGEADEWINYDLPGELVGIALGGKYKGQRQKWFAMRFTGQEDEILINPPPAGNNAEFDDWRWVALEDVPDMVVPFKRAVYEKVVVQFRSFSQS